MSSERMPPYGPPWGRAPRGHQRRYPLAAAIVALVVQIPGVWIAAHIGATVPLIFALLAVVACLVLPLRARFPGPILVTVAVLTVPAIAAGEGPPVAAVPLAFAVVTAIFHGKRAWTWSTLAGLALLGVGATLALTGSAWGVARFFVITVVLCLIAGIAEGARGRRDRYRAVAREVSARRQSAAEAERLRIARELHDILAHSLSEISVQAGVGLHLFDTQPEQARDALTAIRTTSGTALDEVRSVLGVLRDGEERVDLTPEPTLARLDELVTGGARRGVIVTLHRRPLGDSMPAVPVQVALFRIAQEALTNVAKHAGPGPAEVLLERRGDVYVLEVANPGRTGPAPAESPAADADHVGRGVIGMRERADLLGGTLEAGPDPDGGWRVTARIPVSEGHA